MRFIAPRTGAYEVTVAEEQEEYMPLTAAIYKNSNYPGAVNFLFRCTFTDEERTLIAHGEDIFISQLAWPDGKGTFAKVTPMTIDVGMQHWKVDPPIAETGDGDSKT